MITAQQEKEFAIHAGLDLLKTAIVWISQRLAPEDVFSGDDLAEWARNNGWEKPV